MSQMLKERSRQSLASPKPFLKQLMIWIKLTLLGLLTTSIITVAQQNAVQAQYFDTGITDTPAFQLHHVTLSVSDAERVAQWYVDRLGFTISDRFTLTRPNGSQVQVVRIEAPGLQMNISEFDGSVAPDRTVDEQGWRHLAFQVDNVDQTYQRLQASGVQFLTEPFTYDPPGYRIAFFKDLEGNILELYQDL